MADALLRSARVSVTSASPILRRGTYQKVG